MARIALIIFFAYVANAVLTACPKFVCSNSVENGKCATISGNEILLPTTGCSTGTSCSLKSIKEWYGIVSETLATTSSLNCGPFDSTPFLTFEDGDVDCASKPTGHDLVEGSYPKACTTNEDCATTDGADGQCVCGLSGTYACKPKSGSSYWSTYWAECTEGDDELEGGRYYWWEH
jgi:hypothetical protein